MYKSLFFLLICFLTLPIPVSAQQESTKLNIEKLTIYWDSSLSMLDKDLGKELNLLNNYFIHIHNLEVDLIIFSNSINKQQTFSVVDSNWDSLKKVLINTTYDGVAFYDILLTHQESDINLLFTDGVEILDKLKIDKNIPTYSISSTKVVNETKLLIQSLGTGGDYINLNAVSIAKALELLNIKVDDVIAENFIKQNKIIAKKNPEKGEVLGEVFGEVYGEEGILVGATISIKGTSKGVISDVNGTFSIKANKGDVLVISYLGKQPKEVTIMNFNILDIYLVGDETELAEVLVKGKLRQEPEMVETGFGKVNKDKLGYAVKTISEKELMSANVYNISDAVRGKMGATKYTSNNADISMTVFRGVDSFLSNVFPLVVIDGFPMVRNSSVNPNTNKLVDFINPANVASVTILKGLAATNRYGSEGGHGVIIITTKMSLGSKKSKKPYNSALLRNNNYTENLAEVNTSIKDIPYIKALNTHKTLAEVYAHYLKQRVRYFNDPLYFVNVSDFVAQWGNKELSTKILSNVLEMNSKEVNPLRLVAYKAEQNKDVFLAKRIYEKIAKLKPNEAQSYRDLALIYQETGYYQKALDIYKNIKNNKYSQVNFSGSRKHIENEMKRLILLQKSKLNLKGVPAKYLNIKKIAGDARIVFDWNDRAAEFELQFVNPQKKFFTWSHTKQENLSRLVQEREQGFNTEEFLLIDAEKGKWLINVESKLQGRTSKPIVLKYTVFKNYGKVNETKETKLLILNNIKEKQMVGKIII